MKKVGKNVGILLISKDTNAALLLMGGVVLGACADVIAYVSNSILLAFGCQGVLILRNFSKFSQQLLFS